jgi:hypothetical protein
MARFAHLVAENAALQQDRDHDRNAKQTNRQQSASPADERHQERRHRRSGRKTEIAAERV